MAYNWRDRIDVEDLRSALGEPSTMAKDFSCDLRMAVRLKYKDDAGPRFISLRVVCLKHAPRLDGRKSSKHRLFVECPDCKTLVPAGRLHQHRGTRKCQNKKAGA